MLNIESFQFNYSRLIRSLKSFFINNDIRDKYFIIYSEKSITSGLIAITGLEYRYEVSGFVEINYANGVSYLSNVY